MSNTHTFKLPSGVMCEVTELTGKQQRILTEQKNKKLGENLNDMLVTIIKRVGSQTDIDINFVRNLLAADRRKILAEARQFTMDFDPVFKFDYQYTDKNGMKQSHPLEIDLSAGFPTTTLKVEKDGKLVDADYTEYADIKREQFFVLPKSGKKIRWVLLDGSGEAAAMAVKKTERSSHTALQIRKPVYFEVTEKDTVPIQLDLDSVSLKDVEALRKRIKEVEGAVDTEIMFDHPEAELKPAKEKDVVIDLLGETAFFFPSEAI